MTCDTVSVSQDEDADNRTERTWGNIELRTRYSHVDLIHMIGGADLERGAVTRDGCFSTVLIQDSYHKKCLTCRRAGFRIRICISFLKLLHRMKTKTDYYGKKEKYKN